MTSDQHSMNDLAEHSLELVQQELNNTLDSARREIEEFVDGRNDRESLLRAAGMLHLAGGALKIVEVHGAALLADEMEQTCRFLHECEDPKLSEKGAEALTRAMVQLPAYLDRLLSGGRDVAIVLLPLLNDLRSVRGKPLMSEGTLLLLRTGPLERSSQKSPSGETGAAREDYKSAASQHRPAFQTALLGWIRGAETDHNLEELISISSTLEQAAGTRPVQQFWGVLCGIFVAVRANGLEPSVALKRLVGQADRQLKLLIEGGENAFAAAPPSDLLNNLLYYIVRAKCDDQRIKLIRSEFDLDDVLPGEAQLEAARQGLAGPSVKLMRTVADAIKQDLATVKDSLDIFVRTGMQDFRQLLPQLELLRKIGDTLGVLGLDDARGRIQAQTTSLAAAVEAGAELDRDALEEVAAVLLRVEDELDRELVRAVVRSDDDPADMANEAQYGQVTQAVMGECIVNLARVKESVVKVLEEPGDGRALEQIKPLLRGIAAGLLMLNKTTAVRIIERIGKAIETGLSGGAAGKPVHHVERLADAIVSVEYYMETISAGRKDPWYMLDNASRSLDKLPAAHSAPPEGHAAPGLDAQEAGDALTAQSGEIERRESSRPEAGQAFAPSPRSGESAGETAGESTQDPQVFAADEGEDRPDPELVEVFIEEAKEEIAKIDRFLPVWLDNSEDTQALISTRRSFHTLKGSGRTVGAQAIGEFAWSLENLMNRLINKTLEPTPAIEEVIRQAASALPALIDQLELGIEPKIDTAKIAAAANSLAQGQYLQDEDETESAAPATAERTSASTDMDPVLAQIFVKEARGHVGTIRAFLEEADRDGEGEPLEESVYRASHTLLGSANMANFEPCVQVADPLAEYLGHLHEAGESLSRDGLEALEQAAETIEEMLNALLGDTPATAPPALLEKLHELAEKAAEAKDEATSSEPELQLELEADEGTLADEGTGAGASSDPAAQRGAETADAQIVPEAEPEAAAGTMEFDPEIAAIFSEEAAEILDEAEAHVQSFRNGASPQSSLAELQRLLHTLKGGARLAGLSTMGDLSHAFETLLQGLANDRVPLDSAVFDLVQRALDALQDMRDCIDTGRAFADCESLIAEVLGVAEGRAPVAAELPADNETARKTVPETEDDVPWTEENDATSVMPRLQADASDSSGRNEDPLEMTGTVEFSDEEMAKLQKLAFETIEESEAAQQEAADSLPDLQLEAVAAEPREKERLELELTEPEQTEPEQTEPEQTEAEQTEAELTDPEPTEEAPTEAEPAEADQAEEAPQDGAAAGPDAAIELSEPPTSDVDGAAGDTAAGDRPAAAPKPAASIPVSAQPEGMRSVERVDTARVDAQLLDTLLNASGEISIFQARLGQQLRSIEFHLSELGDTVTRLREQLRKLEAETEAEILSRYQDDTTRNEDFDPLELDRYSTIQQLSRGLGETASDVASINELLVGLTTEADTLLTQQGRVTGDIQDGLMQTRMVPFQRHVARLARVVRQASADTGKPAELIVTGGSSELDRQVLDSMLPAFEHLLRNAVVHGIEAAAERAQRGKPATGKITIALDREGAEVSIDIHDDGGGLNIDGIRSAATERGLIPEGQTLTDKQAAELILRPGFSTAGELTQAAGRGVGMDIVDNELKKLGGSMQIRSDAGKGTHFLIRLPYTLAITHALIVDVGEETFALPLTTVEGITRVRREALLDLLTQDDPRLDYGDLSYRLQHLGSLVGAAASSLSEEESAVALVLIRAGDNSTALLTDRLEGSREVVVKSLGPHISSVPGVTGATILGDGRVIIILDVATLIREQKDHPLPAPVTAPEPSRTLTALVVDDSITMRRVTERLLERRGVRVVTARDGLDAVGALQEHDPDIILLDIEMPRMDGYQFAAHVRNDPKHRDLPIIMITSRSGEKHRAKAIELGVNEYLGKPYQENQLVAAIEAQLGRRL